MSNCVSEATRIALRKRHANESAAKRTAILTRLNANGAPSKMHDATTRYATAEEAVAKVAYWRQVNPGKTMRFTLDGVEI